MDVIFEEDIATTRKRPTTSNAGPIVKLIIKLSDGRIQNESTASVCLLIIAVVALVLSVIVMRTLVIAPPAEPLFSPYDG